MDAPSPADAGPVFVALPAEIDVGNCERIGAELRAAVRPGVTVVIADGSLTTFCDSSGIRQLVQAHQHAVGQGAGLRLICSAPYVLRVLQVLGVDQVLPVYPDFAAALTGLPQRNSSAI